MHVTKFEDWSPFHKLRVERVKRTNTLRNQFQPSTSAKTLQICFPFFFFFCRSLLLIFFFYTLYLSLKHMFMLFRVLSKRLVNLWIMKNWFDPPPNPRCVLSRRPLYGGVSDIVYSLYYFVVTFVPSCLAPCSCGCSIVSSFLITSFVEKKVKWIFRECHNHKSQPIPGVGAVRLPSNAQSNFVDSNIFGTMKFVQDMRSLSHWGLIIAPG